MSLNDDQFHVVKSTYQVDPSKHRDSTYSGDHHADFVINRGVDVYPVGRVQYTGRNGWNTPDDYDAAFDNAKVGETPPMFTKQAGGYVGTMAVDPAYQGHGFGKELAHRVLEHHWEQNPEQFGSMPGHSELSSASGGMIEHLAPGHGISPGNGWDENFDPDDHGIHREDYGFDEDDPDWDGEWDDLAYEDDVDNARQDAAEYERDNFAHDQMDEARDSSIALSNYAEDHPGEPLGPGTSLGEDGGWTYSIAHPPKYSQEQAQHIVNHGAPEPEAPEAQQPRPFRNGQMRLPGTYQRRLP